jgi:hypothetical protein
VTTKGNGSKTTDPTDLDGVFASPYGEGKYPHILRKEVIQPHLPIRLPCYDLVPLTPHTLDGSLPYGLGHRLRVQTIQVT